MVARPKRKEKMTNKQATGGKEEGNLERMKRGEIKCSNHKAINGFKIKKNSTWFHLNFSLT